MWHLHKWTVVDRETHPSAFDDIELAVREAHTTIRRADIVNRRVANMLRWRLKVAQVDHSTLYDLKRELQDYNMHTAQWKER